MRKFFRSFLLVLLLQIIVLAQTDYYSGISTSDPALISKLHDLIYNHTQISYASFDETNVKNFASIANSNGSYSVFCVYSHYEYNYTGTFAWGTMSREHTWCHSWMPSYPSESGKEYSDQHHLFPTEQNHANGVRSNYPLGEVVSVTSSFLEGKFGKDAAGNTVYEPRDAHKGDAARAIFYMSVCYDGTGGRWTIPNSQMTQSQEVLKKWNKQDLPDEWEKKRNDYVYSIQKNRNPFVDHPEYADFIDFSSLSYITSSSEMAAEPTNYITDLSASNVTDRSITLKWSDAAAGTQVPSAYLIVYGSKSVSFVPSDSTYYNTDTDLSDGIGYANVLYSAADSSVITGLNGATRYYFKVYSYNGSGSLINYKTDGTVPAVDTVTIQSVTYSVNENFSSFPENTSSYKDGSFTGADGSTWTYKQCRGDLKITDATPCLGKDRSTAAEVKSGTIKNGCKVLSFDYMQAFSTNVKLDVYVNGVKVKTVTSSGEPNIVKSSGDITVDVQSDFVLSFLQPSGGGQVCIDNVKWSSYSTTPVELVSCTAEPNGNSVLLKWATATELNSLSFEIERKKTTEKQWQNIGSVKSAGTSYVRNAYSFKDVLSAPGKYAYRLKQIDLDGAYKYYPEVNTDVIYASNFVLEQNYPNPFNPATSIKYSIPSGSHVILTVYDQLGRKISELVNGFQNEGGHEVQWNAGSLSSGIYFYELRNGDSYSIKKMTLLK